MEKEKGEKQNHDEDEKLDNYDALDGCSTIAAWERKEGRGFWGNSSTGYHYDSDVNN